MDPAPRISILHALSNTSAFTFNPDPRLATVPSDSETQPKLPETPTKNPTRRTETPSNQDPPVLGATTETESGNIKDLETLYGLWKGAGKSVNLWDWFTGYLGSFDTDHDHDHDDEEGVDEGDEPARISLLRKRKRAQEQGQGQEQQQGQSDEAKRKGNNQEEETTEAEVEEVKRDRLHAAFVRFCEEARMLGMVRARGKGVGRRADEVVKGFTLV